MCMYLTINTLDVYSSNIWTLFIEQMDGARHGRRGDDAHQLPVPCFGVSGLGLGVLESGVWALGVGVWCWVFGVLGVG